MKKILLITLTCLTLISCAQSSDPTEDQLRDRDELHQRQYDRQMEHDMYGNRA